MSKMREDSDKFYTIGQLSNILGIPVSTLRFYDRKKLLVPQKRDENSNYRYYAESQIFEALNLVQLKHLGMPLLDIKQLLGSNRLRDLKQSIKERMLEYQAVIQQAEARYNNAAQLYRQLDAGMEILDGDEPDLLAPDIAIQYVPQVTVISQRIKVKNFDITPSLQGCVKIFQLCEKENLRVNGSFHMLFLGHAPERFQTGNFEALIFFPIQPTDRILPEIQSFGGFWSINVLHIGKYHALTSLYQQLRDEIEQRSLTVIGDPFEEYILHHYHVEDEEHFVTRISFPIQEPLYPAE